MERFLREPIQYVWQRVNKMTWTVTDHGITVTAAFGTPVQSLSMTGLSISAGKGVVVFVQYTDTQTDSVSVTDSASNAYTLPANVNFMDATVGQGCVALYNAALANALSSGSITASFGTGATNVIQTIGVIEFSNSVAGTPTLDG